MTGQYPYGATDPTTGRPVTTPPPSRRKVWGVLLAGVAVIALSSAACGPDDDSPEANAAVLGYTVPTSARATAPAEVPEVADADASSVYGEFLEENGVTSVTEREARRIAQAACAVLREQTYPGAENYEAVAIGTIIGAQREYPELSDYEAPTVIGAGTIVYCPEMKMGGF